jgi:hypothetical protein
MNTPSADAKMSSAEMVNISKGCRRLIRISLSRCKDG